MSVFNINFGTVKNVGNNLQICVATNTKVGQEMSRQQLNEQPHFDNIEYHPDNSKVFKRLNRNELVRGKIKLFWKWTAEDNITQTDINFVKSIYAANNSEDSYAAYEQGEDYLNITIEKPETNTTWSDTSVGWELASSEAGIEILKDDTVLFCSLSEDFGWKHKTIDLADGATVDTSKSGEHCYLWFDGECELNGTKNVYAGDVKKLINETVNIKNVNATNTKIIMEWK